MIIKCIPEHIELEQWVLYRDMIEGWLNINVGEKDVKWMWQEWPPYFLPIYIRIDMVEASEKFKILFGI